MVERVLLGPGGATEVTLAGLLAELQTKLDAGGTVALDGPTLAALESITALVSGTVALDAPTLAALENITVTVDNPTADPATQTTLAQVLAELQTKLDAGGTVALDAPTLAALENITVTVDNPTADPETGLATSAKQDLLLAKFVKELTERMLNKQPDVGYALWFDTADANHIYTLEAPAATAAGAVGFRGIRVILVGGFPVGKVETNVAGTLTFTNRAADGGWA